MEEDKAYRIMVVEDETSLARSIQLELEHEGYHVATAQNGYEALGKLAESKWDLIILDLMLPGLDGFQVCQKIREKSDVPVIMLTALDAVRDKVKGFETGADDYLTKPFAIEELSVRIKARLRKPAGALIEGNKLVVKDLVIRRDTRQVTRASQSIPLSKREFDLLTYLAENTGTVLSREIILNRVWGYDFYGDTNVVDVYIRYLRAKVDEPFDTPLLQTIRGVGYTLREEK
ncbi:MAG TPA: response regulator transcription factor [Bacillota bacterium]|nr:response regulator transcription factor [Bacillota bacterium]